MKRKLAACFVYLDSQEQDIIGYYTLSNTSIPLDYFSEPIRKKLPPTYRSIPTTLLGRLAIDQKYQSHGHGEKILMHALTKCYETSLQIASFAVVVDPIDHAAAQFYQKYDFISLPDSQKMFLPMKVIEELCR
ncbi:GNAT family N-acetyltransferase [Aquirufa sp. ROCK2-A2]